MYIYEHNPSPEAQPDKQKQKQISQRRNINMINVSAHMLSIRLCTADMSLRASGLRSCLCCKRGGVGWGSEQGGI